MKKLFIGAFTAIAMSAPTVSFAAKAKGSPTPSATPAATPAAAATPAPAKPIPMYSEVTTIDPATKSWIHKNASGKEVKFVVTDQTEVKQMGVAAKFEDIKVGDWVSGVRLKKSDTEYEVLKITKFGVKSEKPAKGGKATPAPKN